MIISPAIDRALLSEVGSISRNAAIVGDAFSAQTRHRPLEAMAQIRTWR